MTFAVVSTEEVNEASAIQKFYEFLAKNPTRLARVLGEPDIKVTATTTTNDTGTVANLTTLGFEFPANTIRVIRTRTYARGDISDGDDLYLETTTAILGGATPAVLEATVDTASHGEGDYAGGTDVSVSTADVIVTVTGVTSVATNWQVHIFVDELVYISGGQA
jgi:hypothetical protein